MTDTSPNSTAAAPVPNKVATSADLQRPAWWLRAAGSLPFPVLYALGKALAWFARVIVRFRRATVRENLRRCFPDMSAAQLAATERQHYADMSEAALELFKLATMSSAELRERVRFIDAEKLHAELASGHKVMLLTAHQGNWEWLLQRLAVEFAPQFICAYKPLRHARFDRDVLQLRTRFGAIMTPAKGMLRTLLRRRDAHVTAIAADQMPRSSPARVWLDFMGQRTAFYPGPADIAARYHYGAWFMAMHRRARGYYEVEFIPIAASDAALDAEIFTARYAECVAARLRREPADWAWGHRRWKADPAA